MRIVLAGNKERGVVCLRALLDAGHEIVAVLAHPEGAASGGVAEEAASRGLQLLRPADVNDDAVADRLKELRPDVIALAGYGQILREPLILLAPHGCVNLHGGRLPQYRGSSPMNWALINGEDRITLSAILIDVGVDTGDIVGERTFEVGPDETIADVQERANQIFPELLVDVIDRLERGALQRRKQEAAEAAYWPLRFPDDGLIVWDLLPAKAVHDRIRALAPPYPGAFTVWDRRRVRLLRSRLEQRVVRGEPGRVYAAGAAGLLICAADRCVRIVEAVCEDDGTDAIAAVRRYDTFATARQLVLKSVR